MSNRRHGAIGTIGRTPCHRLRYLPPPHVQLYARLEIAGSAAATRERHALALLQAERASGALQPGQTVVDVSDGRGGTGLAVACAYAGHPLLVVTHAPVCPQWRRLLHHLGARLVRSDPSRGRKGAVAKAWHLANDHDFFLVDQRSRGVGVAAQARTIAREILEDFADGGPDYVLAGPLGADVVPDVVRLLRKERLDAAPLACAATVGDGGGRADTAASWADETLPIGDELALQTACDALMREGIACGPEGGRTLAAALALCGNAPAGSTVLCLLPGDGPKPAVAAQVERRRSCRAERAVAAALGFGRHRGQGVARESALDRPEGTRARRYRSPAPSPVSRIAT